MDHSLANAGLKPDEEKVQTITEFPAPHERFIEMVKHLPKFNHLLTIKYEPFNRLSRKDQIFQWAEVPQRAFEDIKKTITNTPVLTYYDLEKPVTI